MSPPSGSGKHTPTAPTGDFAEFLQAEELKARLADEQEAEYKRELKAAKGIKKPGGFDRHHGHGGSGGASGDAALDIGGHGMGGRGKPETPEERWRRLQGLQKRTPDYVPDQPTLEERGYFPGDLLHHGHLAVRSSSGGAGPSAPSSKRKSGTTQKHASTNSSPIMRVERLKPPGICGPVSDSEEEEEEEVVEGVVDEDAEHGEEGILNEEGPDIKAVKGRRRRSMSSWLRRASRQSHAAEEEEEEEEIAAGDEGGGDDDDDDEASSVSSYASSIAAPHNAPPAKLNPSIVSLKSFDSDATGVGSLASGGANAKLARPLLELEELELDSFLKNFGRHTREVRVPHSANFPQRRMPRWEDFKVPPGEAALAAAQGKRVTVLTHVDRGLRALEASEGEGVPLPRVNHAQDSLDASRSAPASTYDGKEQHSSHHHHLPFFHSSKKKDKGKKKEKEAAAATTSDQSKPGSTHSGQESPSLSRKPSSATVASPSKQLSSLTSPTNSSSTPPTPGQSSAVQPRPSIANAQPRVSWAPTPSTLGVSLGGNKDKSSSSATDYGKNAPRPDSPDITFGGLRRRSMEKDEKLAKRQDEVDRARISGAGGARINVHDEQTEWRPSRDEAHLNDEDWELLHGTDAMDEAEVGEVLVSAKDDAGDDSQVDGVAWAIAYILATIERYAPEELDNTPDQSYRESRTRSHIERLYLIAPFWERLLFGIRRVYRWDDPRRTSTIAMIYFTLWYLNAIPTAFMLCLMYFVCQFRFFPPSASYLHEQVRARMARGVDADRLAERLRRRSRLDVLEIYKRFVVAYGSGTQLACGDVADFHEKVKNLILWRNPTATWRTLFLLGVATAFVTFASAHFIWKTVFAFLGLTFFILLPLQSHYPRFRRPLSPIWWALWGAPTDAQFAIQLLRRRHLERQIAKHPKSSDDAAAAATGHFDGGHAPTSSSAAAEHNAHKMTSQKAKFARPSSAAHAVAYGALRPFRSSNSNADGAGGSNPSRPWEANNLLDLQDVKVLDGGQILSKPRKLGSFFCQHHGVPGHLHVTTRMLYFVALHSHATSGQRGGSKTCKTLLGDISGLVKTKSIKLLVWNSSGLQITRRNKSSLFFSNMPHRDNAFNLLLAVGSEVWHRHA